MNYLSATAAPAVGRACVYGSIFILAVWMTCRCVKRLSDSARCGLWWLASFKLLLGLFLFASVAIPLLPLSHKVKAGDSFAASQSSSEDMSPTSLSTQTHTPPASSGGNISPTTFASGFVHSPETYFPWQTVETALFALWALVVLFRMGYLCRSLFLLRLSIARSRTLEDPALILIAKEVADAFGIVRMPRLCVSETVTDPLLCGLFRKVILLSNSDVTKLSPAEFRLVIAHECAHLRRGDLWLSLIPAITQTVYCFFPPAWLACSEFEATREAACDAAALNKLNAEPAEYGRLLLKLSCRPERLDPLSLAGALGVSSHLRLLRRRIAMLQFRPTPANRRAIAGTLLALGCGLIGLAPWRVVAAGADGSAKHGRTKQQAPSGSVPSSLADVPAHPQNLDFSSGMSGWRKIEGVNGKPPIGGGPEFAAEIDPNGPHPGVPALSLESRAMSPKRSAIVIQSIRADAYRGKRYRFSALVKTENAEAAAGVGIMENAVNGQRVWNCLGNPVPGTTDWKRYEYVLDIVPTSTTLEFGALLDGLGKVEVSDVRFEPVDKSVPVSRPYFDTLPLPAKPVNLNFAHGIMGWQYSTRDGEYSYFSAGLDSRTKHNGDASLYLACNSDRQDSYGVITQWIDATPYRGKRIRLSGYIKTAAIRGYGGLIWFMNSAVRSEERYDMRRHAIKGDHDWTRVAFVADVPPELVSITIGVNIEGRGTVWMDDLKFEVVGRGVPLTPAYHDVSNGSTAPQNLNSGSFFVQ